MWIFYLEAAVALALLGGIVWASMPRAGRPRRPLRADPEQKADEAEKPCPPDPEK